MTKEGSLIGDAGEHLVKAELEKQGLTVEKFHGCTSKKCLFCGWLRKDLGRRESPFDRQYPKHCQRGEKWVELMKRRDELEGRFLRSRSSDNTPSRELNKGVNLDFYVMKGDEKCIVEVKANSGRLSEEQRELMEYAVKLGFKVLIYYCIIDVFGKIDKVKTLERGIVED